MDNDNENVDKKNHLPYFHRVLSLEEQTLIGDISPKPIEKNTVEILDCGSIHQPSVWNTAQTFEQRSFNQWGIDKLKSLLEDFTVSSSSCNIEITSNEVTGSATIAHVRGKARYLYDFNIKLNFNITKDLVEYKGSISLDDFSPDDIDDINFQISWTNIPPSSEFTLIKSFINKEFKIDFKKKIVEFEKQFREI